MVKLDTTEAVMNWAMSQDPDAVNGIDLETAEYIAECVRLRYTLVAAFLNSRGTTKGGGE